MNGFERWWSKDAHAARRPALITRGHLKAALRGHFSAQGFTEVEAGQLQISPGNETHLHGFQAEMVSPSGEAAPLYLHTSPEFACKKLLAAGETRIFDFARVFRNRERGALHAPEFTMLEWYRAGEPYEQLMLDCGDILAIAADIGRLDTWSYRGRTINPRLAPERISVADAFHRFAGVDLLATVQGMATDPDGLAAMAVRAGVRVAPDDSWSDIFSRIMIEKVEPNFGNGRATLLIEYPAPEAALARPKAGNPHVAERFELFACGVELANAFGELTDATEQRRRFAADMATRQAIYSESYPLDEEFLEALSLMPEASGAALGFDRLVMLATGVEHINKVLWTPAPDPFKDRP